tara:strand:- start:1408 stop:1833 length:426 start_codon:yes stop_codon:yes gene_type:complete
MNCHKDDVHWCTVKGLTHDFEEMISGDIPTPYKKHLIPKETASKIRSGPKAMALSITGLEPIDHVICYQVVAVADVFEACMFLKDEIHMGNTTVYDLYLDIGERLKMMVEAIDEDGRLWDELTSHLDNTTRTRVLTEHGLK